MDGKSENEIGAEVERVMQELDFWERDARERGEQVVRMDEERLRRKIGGEETNSPFFSGWGGSNAPPGGTAYASFFVTNPDPVSYYYHGYVVLGPSSLIQDTGLSLTAVDTRFPRYSRSLSVGPNSSMSRDFPIPIPLDFTPGLGGYIGSCYMVDGLFYVGLPRVIDRTTFYIGVSFP